MTLALTLSPAFKAYAALLLGVWAATAGVPIPEEITLLTAGVLASMGIISVRWAIVLGIFACFSGDSVVFAVARRIGDRMDDYPRLRKIMRGRFARKARHLYVHRGPWTLFIARLMPGLKMPFVFTAGAFRMPWRKFLFYDLASVVLLVPTLVLLAYYTSPSLARAKELISGAGMVVGSILIAVLAGLYWLSRRARQRRLQRVRERNERRLARKVAADPR